ncbi:MAG TPA: 30S ribosomal protein S3 [Candidatus Dojkabacteria bacterium]|jgi:small subunit ribosomal protein S3
MGQKVNPTGFRLGINKNWKSQWFAQKDDYSKNLLEDIQTREFVADKLSNAGVADVIVKRFANRVMIEVHVARPGVVIGRGGAGIEQLKGALKKKIKSEVEVKIFEVKRPEISAALIAQNVRSQVERRIVPKYAAQREIDNARNTGVVKGVRIWVAGRIKGAEIARTEKFQWGTVPLQTLRADIDYISIDAQVPNAGKHGIKVWVFKGEKTTTDEE